jgi:hypothetical protein
MTTWLASWLTSRLSAAEQEAVLGDAAERGMPAVRDLLSVLVWREAHAWTTAAPWLALVTLVLPLGFVLSVVARYWAGGFAVMLWIYVNNWTWEYLTNPGARLDVLIDFVGKSSLQIVCLVLWSWMAGRALRLVSPTAVDSNRILLTGIVLMGTVGTTTIGALTNGAVFSSTFYRVVLPLLTRIAFVVVPLWRGTRRNTGNTPWGWTLAQTAAATILIGGTFKWLAGALVYGWVSATIPNPRTGNIAFWWATQLHTWSLVLRMIVPLALAWPAAYVLIQARRQRMRAA